MNYRKKPLVIQAIRWDGNIAALDPLFALGVSTAVVEQSLDDPTLYIPTLEGRLRIDVGDWVIRGVKGELYPCKDEIFQATYEAV
jgi:hypothetical protein